MSARSVMMDIWQGVFASFDEAGARLDGHVNPLWIKKSVDRFEAEKRSSELGGADLLTSVVGLSGASPVRVIDVGGNLGATFLAVSRQIGSKPLNYTVLELQDFLDEPLIRRSLLSDVTYISSLDQLKQPQAVDIVYFGSVIQYFSDWKSQIAEIVEKSGPPNHLVFDDLMVGPQTSFVSNQKYYEDQMTMWFLNEGEFIKEVESLGYSLSIRKAFKAPGADYFPANSLPESFRIPFAQSAVFSRRL